MAKKRKKGRKGHKRARKLYTPEEVQARVKAKYAQGKSKERIAREERLNPKTINGILVRAKDRQRFLQHMQEKMTGLCEPAYEAVLEGLYGPLQLAVATGVRVLESQGLMPKLAKLLHQMEAKPMEFEGGVQTILAMMLNSAARRNKVYRLPDVDIEPEPRPAREKSPTDVRVEAAS